MNYIRTEANGQLAFAQSTGFLKIPSCLYGFEHTETTEETAKSERTILCFKETLDSCDEKLKCSCGAKIHINNHSSTTLRHLPWGRNLTCVTFSRNQYACPKCGKRGTS